MKLVKSNKKIQDWGSYLRKTKYIYWMIDSLKHTIHENS